MEVGPDNHDSFFIEGQSNSGPNDDNFAEDDDFNGPPQGGYYGGPRGPPGMSGPRGPMGPMGMGPRGPMRPYGGGPPMGHRGPPPFGMQRGPPHGGYGGPRPPGPPGGQRYPGPPRGMGGPGPRGPMQGGYGGDYGGPRQMRPHYQQDSGNGPGMDSMDGPQRGGWDMQGPPNQQNGGQGYMGGGQHQGPPQNYGNMPPPQHYASMTPHQGYNNGPNHNNYGPGGGGMQSGPGSFNSQQQPPSSGQSTAQDMDTSTSSNEEVWVETKSADGKSYYYHAKSRETTWTKPEGPNVKVLSQQQVEAMAQQQSAAKPADGGSQQNSNNYGNPPQQQPYYPQPGWNVPQAAPVAPAPVLGPGPMPYPVLLGSDPGTDPVILSQAMEWCQYRSPEGKPYFFNVKTSASVWEKPQILKDYEVARLAAAARVHAGGNIPTVQIIPEPLASEMKGMKKDETKISEPPSKESISKPEVKEAKEEVKVPKDKSRPVSSTPVAGTPWCVVWTGDGRVFFYNPSTRSSVWEKPEDLKHRPDVDKLLANTPDNIISEKKDDVKEDTKKKRSDSFVEEPPVKKVKTVEEDKNDVKPEEPAKDSAMEAEVKAAQQRAVIPLEERVTQFKEMLAEKEVSAFSTWEKELHKIVFDSRYLLLTSKERKDVYEDFVRERVEEERREKRNRMKEKKDDFRRLMEDARLNGKSSFSDFSHKYAKDERFRGVEKTRERESLFNEFIVEIRRREKDERDAQREKLNSTGA